VVVVAGGELDLVVVVVAGGELDRWRWSRSASSTVVEGSRSPAASSTWWRWWRLVAVAGGELNR